MLRELLFLRDMDKMYLAATSKGKSPTAMQEAAHWALAEIARLSASDRRAGKLESERDEARRAYSDAMTLAESINRELAVARARIAAVAKWVNKAYCGGLPPRLHDADAWYDWSAALHYRIDTALSGADALAVVDTETHFRNDLPPNVADDSLWISCQVPGKWPGPVRVVVLSNRGESAEAPKP